MFIQIFTRITFGGIFGYLGFVTSNLYFDPAPLFGVKFLGQSLSALLASVFGLFLFPIIIGQIRSWVQSIVDMAVKDSFGQIQRIRSFRDNPHEKNNGLRSQRYPSPVLLDTSAIIDGRIADIVTLGFLPLDFLVPQFILSELQHVADSSDVLKRNRGRRGLEILENLKRNPGVRVKIIENDFNRIKAVDSKLIKLAKVLKAKIITTDYNLNKVAAVSGVRVLNVNELANALKTVVLPGEKIKIKVIQEGKEPGQGVGYLPDGTMVVVEEGEELLNQTIEAEVSRIFQTAAGKMIFVKIL